jgi:hypothetical protein
MLTRRAVLTGSVAAVTGASLVDPIGRWLGVESSAFTMNSEGTERIALTDVERIEQVTSHFMATDAAVGGGVCREAAVGQLKYTVDLARHAAYSERVGHRLLAAIADLSAWVGWMSHDLAMHGPAQRYLVYGLQAARESHDERAPLRAIGILADLARQMHALGHPDDGLRLVGLALESLPKDGRKLNKIRALLWSLRAQMLATMGTGYLPEVHSAIGLSFELYGQIGDEDQAPAVMACFPYTTDAELASTAAAAYRTLAVEIPSLAGEAANQALYALSQRPETFARSRVLDRIELARARLLAGEPDQAAADGETALEAAKEVSTSRRVVTGLRSLLRDADAHEGGEALDTLKYRLRTAIELTGAKGAGNAGVRA